MPRTNKGEAFFQRYIHGLRRHPIAFHCALLESHSKTGRCRYFTTHTASDENRYCRDKLELGANPSMVYERSLECILSVRQHFKCSKSFTARTIREKSWRLSVPSVQLQKSIIKVKTTHGCRLSAALSRMTRLDNALDSHSYQTVSR